MVIGATKGVVINPGNSVLLFTCHMDGKGRGKGVGRGVGYGYWIDADFLKGGAG